MELTDFSEEAALNRRHVGLFADREGRVTVGMQTQFVARQRRILCMCTVGGIAGARFLVGRTPLLWLRSE